MLAHDLGMVEIEKDFEDCNFKSSYGMLHYVHHGGPGPKVVFIHGFAGTIRSWTRLVRFLPEEFDIYIIDLLGNGGSEAPDADYSLKVHYQTVKELVSHLGLKRYCIFGHSYGGWIAAYYAMQDGAESIVLEDSAGLAEFARERHEENPNYREEMVKRALSINPRENVLRNMVNADNSDALLTPSGLSTIESRTLLIWGSEDAIVKLKYARVFLGAIRGSRLEVLYGEKHTPHYTNPEAVARLLIGFLEKE